MAGRKVVELRPAMFSAGEVLVTREAFEKLREVGLRPEDVVNRHVRGDWDGAAVKWIERNELRRGGVTDWPVMSVYQLHPSETRVCVATEADLSKTGIEIWPVGDTRPPFVTVKAAEERYEQERNGPAQPGSEARKLLDRDWGKGAKGQQIAKGKSRDKGHDDIPW